MPHHPANDTVGRQRRKLNLFAFAVGGDAESAKGNAIDHIRHCVNQLMIRNMKLRRSSARESCIARGKK